LPDDARGKRPVCCYDIRNCYAQFSLPESEDGADPSLPFRTVPVSTPLARMKTLRPLRLSLVAGLTSLVGVGVVGQAQAQSVATVPVGAVTKDIPVGLVDLGVTLTNPPVLRGAVSSNTDIQLTVGGLSSVGSLLTAGEPYYVEFVSGVRESERFEVDVAATQASDDGSVTIKGSDALNTLPSMAGLDLAGSQVVLRKHVTLTQIASAASPSLLGNNNASLADQIWVFNTSTQQFTTHFLRGDGQTWRQAGTTLTTSNMPVPPGAGLFINKTGGAAKVTFVGEVRSNDFFYKFPAGLSFHSNADPIAHSPSSFGGTGANGWSGNNNASLADQIWTFNPVTRNFTIHFLRGDNLTWRISGTTSDVTLSEIISHSNAFIIKRNTPDGEYIVNSRL